MSLNQCTKLIFCLTIRNRVPVGIAGIVSAHEDIINNIYGVGNIHISLAVNIGSHNRAGGRRAGNEYVVDDHVAGKDVTQSRAPQRFGIRSLDELSGAPLSAQE